MSVVILGVTASREGLTGRQRDFFRHWIARASEVHHGDCLGGDAEAHAIALEAGVPVILHPPVDPRYRAFCQGAALVFKPLPYLERNRRIVDSVEVMLGAPREAVEPAPAPGQGTWSTIRYARKRERRFGVTLHVEMGDA